MNISSLLTFYFINSQAQFIERDINREIAQSLYFVIERFFVQRSSSFVFVLFCQREHTMNFYIDLLEILFGYWGDIKTQIEVNSEGSGPGWIPGERIYSMLLVDSSESFLKMDPAAKVRNYDVNEYYYVFLQNRDRFVPDDVQRILNYCWSNYIINVNIEVQKATGEIIVYSYFPFTADHCGEVVPVEINRFQDGAMMNDVLFPEKLQNMFNCPLRVVTWSSPPYMVYTETEPHSVGGFEGNLLLLLSEVMNFRVQRVNTPSSIPSTVRTDALTMLQVRCADIMLGYSWFTTNRNKVATASFSYLQSQTVAAVLADGSCYELIPSHWFPFDTKSTAALLSVFLATMCMLFALGNLCKQLHVLSDLRNRNVVFNHIACTLGLPSFIQPRLNWTRIFVMTWMIFSLIVRTNYGGVLFHVIRNNLFRRTPSHLQDVIRLNYTAVLSKVGHDAFLQTTFFKETGLSQLIVGAGGGSDSIEFLKIHPRDKFVVLIPLEYLVYYVSTTHDAGMFKALKERVLFQNVCMYFSKHSFLTDRINSLLQRISSVGLLDAWMRKYFDTADLASKKPVRDVTISMGELKFIYFCCGILLLVAGLVFCLEVASMRFKALNVVFRML